MVREADGAPPGSEDRANLFDLVAQVIPAVEAELRASKKAVLLVHPGLLARYAQMDMLERLRDQVGRKGACPGMWVLVAADGQSELPVIDGREVPLISSGQRARVPDPWLKNAPLATAATLMSTTTIDTGRLLADLQRLVQSLKADLLERSREVPEVDAGLRAAHRAIAERRAHGAGVRGLARRLPRAGGGGLGAGLRLRPVHGGQRPDRRDLPGRHGRPPPPGRGRARGLLPRPPARQRPRLPARRLPQGRLDPGGPRPVRRGQDAALGRRPLGRRRRRGCWRSGGRSTPRPAACGGRSESRGATRASWATCTRTSPRRPARSTRCCRRPSSSRSSSSTAR